MTSRRFIAAFAFLAGLLWATEGSALTPFHLWSKRFGSTGEERAGAVAVDPSGNVYITGSFELLANFGGATLGSNGLTDVFLAKYSANGTHLWSMNFGGSSADQGTALATDASGNVYLAGSFNQNANFGGIFLFSNGGEDCFVAKYDASGFHQWSKSFGSTAQDQISGLAVDGSGNVIATGFFQGTVIVDGSSMVSTGSIDAFVIKWNTNSNFQWKRSFGSTGFDLGNSVAVDASGNVFSTGEFEGTMANMGGASLISAGLRDIFVGKFNSAGTHQWSQRFGNSAHDSGADVATDASGNVLLTGVFNGAVNFGGGNLPFVGGGDMFLAKFNTAGTHVWSRGYGGTNSDSPSSIAVDASGNAVVVGTFGSTTNLGTGNLTSAGLWDVFLAKYDANGTPKWSGAFGSTDFDYGFAVASSPAGTAYMAGIFHGTVNFGGSSLTSGGGSDAFFAAYHADPTEPVISSITDVGNDQGRQAQIVFSRSLFDDASAALPVIRYEAYRRIDAPPAALTAQTVPSLSTRQLLDAGWTQVGAVNGHGQSAYAIAVPTIGDSTIALGQYRSVFFVRGTTASAYTFYDSPPDSGYSVDNLAPPPPQNLAYATGDLSWNESTATDFDYFTVYGSHVDAFGAATVIDYSVAPTLDVSGSPYQYYYVTATDFAGNEGRPAKVHPLTGVDGTPKSYVLSVTNYPNPFNPRTTVSYTLPSRGSVTVSIYDARGEHVATLFSGERAAGAYSVSWDGRTDDAAFAASGVYFARIEHNGGVRSRKMVMLK